MGEGLDDAKAELLALHLTGNGDVLDVADAAEPAQKFLLDENAAGADDLVCLTRDDDEDVVRRWLAVAHRVELSRPRLCAHIGRLCEYGEHGEVPALVVRRSQWANLRWKSGCLSQKKELKGKEKEKEEDTRGGLMATGP